MRHPGSRAEKNSKSVISAEEAELVYVCDDSPGYYRNPSTGSFAPYPSSCTPQSPVFRKGPDFKQYFVTTLSFFDLIASKIHYLLFPKGEIIEF